VPLVAHLPPIDDRTYEQIVDEARIRIPRYAPEWTDLNDNDPGMALVQLFAWLTDMLLYRLGRVPELNYLKFLELLGIELAPARPATTLVAFPIAETWPERTVTIPRRTQISAPSETDPRPLVFETDRAIRALRARLSAVKAHDGFVFHDVDLEDTVTPFRPFGRDAVRDSALYLGFDDPEPLPETELLLAFVAPEDEAPAAMACPGLHAVPLTGSELAWELWNGAAWARLPVLSDDTLALSRSGLVELRLPPAAGLPGPPPYPELVGEAPFWIRARILQSAYDTTPELTLVRANAVTATQAETVEDEVLGGSDGSPRLSLRTESAPILPAPERSSVGGWTPSSLAVDVYEGGPDDPVRWTEVQDLLDAGPNDRVYTVNRTTGEVRFGDGQQGLIPPLNPDRPTNGIVAREYRTGGGRSGNVAAEAIDSLLRSIPGVQADDVTNPVSAVGGADEESIEHAKARAPRVIKSRCRAVTREDFELLAEQSGLAQRAKALPLHHPSFRGVEVPGVVSVIVVPPSDDRAGPGRPPPMPSTSTLRALCEFLDAARLLTTELFVLPPNYREVEIRAEVFAEATADLAAVEQAITENLERYFDPLVGGEDESGWPFGGDLFFSRIYLRAFADGVQRVDRIDITLDGEDYGNCQDVELCPDELPYLSGLEVLVRYAEAEGR
jgi:predicted phage baseplate assembly protein